MKTCIVNYASPGRENYLKGQQRLRQSLLDVGYGGDFIAYANTLPPNCPTHQQSPYAFKYFAIRDAFTRGYQLVLWLDASMVVHKDLQPVWDIVKRDGFIVFDNPGCPEAMFTSRDCLDLIGCSPKEAETFSQCCGGCVGFNREHPKAMELFWRMMALARHGQAFRGQSGSKYPKYKGHRHDQSCISFLLRKYGFHVTPNFIIRYTQDSRGIDDDVVIEIRGIG